MQERKHLQSCCVRRGAKVDGLDVLMYTPAPTPPPLHCYPSHRATANTRHTEAGASLPLPPHTS
ncbi:hypothetical protein E2C01_058476 [Portunus trituberculatus]|uniref:Uncharacterized protein n=1 Tax=Portunus trituberculatus TaxID=210409 RepID=A0A5B7GZW9_PORTR|nr:hypothetical protein [Portunus trituberculatus]